jgi:hypothetical protein
MKPIELTADEIKEFDDVNAERLATDHTLKIALGHHGNRMEQHHRTMHDWWERMAGRHSFTLDVVYEVTRVGAKMVIRPKDLKESEQESEKDKEVAASLAVRMIDMLTKLTTRK